jgi:FkbM family methyltransferase
MTRTHKGLLYRLGRIQALHSLARNFGIYRTVNFLLYHLPLRRRLPQHNIVIRLNSLTALATAEEIFKANVYGEAAQGEIIETFADLGCNIGLFPCYLLQITGNKGITGLLIDGDPAMVEQAKWHLKNNELTGCEAICGVVGCETESLETDFFVNPSNTQSSAMAFRENHPFPVQGHVKHIKVPSLTLSKSWTSRFGNRTIDLLKIDIEGMELDFLKREIAFIKTSVKRIVCEWHKWHISFDELNQYVEANGFSLQGISEEDERFGVAIYKSTILNSTVSPLPKCK